MSAVRDAPNVQRAGASPESSTGSSAPSTSRVQHRAILRGKSFDEQVQMLAPADAEEGPRSFNLDPIRTASATANFVEDEADTETSRGGAPAHAEEADLGRTAAGAPASKSAPSPKAPLDPGELTLTQQNSMPNDLPLPGGAFGGMSPRFDFEGITVKHEPGKAWQVSANLKVICSWAVSENGRTNITGPHDPKITRTNYRSVADDLDPAKGPAPDGKPTRDSYFSRFWTAEHEWFHARDTWAWVTSKGIDIAKASFAKASISSDADVQRALSDCRDKLEEGWKSWFGFYESSEAAKPGEQRAYLDGKPHYEAIAKETRERDKDLP